MNNDSSREFAQAGSQAQADTASVRTPASNKRHHSMVAGASDGAAQKRLRVDGHSGCVCHGLNFVLGPFLTPLRTL